MMPRLPIVIMLSKYLLGVLLIGARIVQTGRSVGLTGPRMPKVQVILRMPGNSIYSLQYLILSQSVQSISCQL